jgi:hypothetical protein
MATRIAWILGAGFSRSLGGPLLDDLLTEGMRMRIAATYGDSNKIRDPGEEHSRLDEMNATEARAKEVVRTLYLNHGPRPAIPTGSQLWQDAEAFIDYIDAATHPQGQRADRAHLRALLSEFVSQGELPDKGLRTLHDAARRLVAEACCEFMSRANLVEERWQPYKRWAGLLVPEDCVVTFNYDRVLERLAVLDVFLPSTPPSGKRAVLYKLHGSVDWKRRRQNDGSYAYEIGIDPYDGKTHDPEFALHCIADDIGIATPGPSKRVATGHLKAVWDQALSRLQEAHRIVFLGYRFPPTDAEARERLLEAVTTNTIRGLSVHVVLGPLLSAPDVARLSGLLDFALRRGGRMQVDEYETARKTIGAKITTNRTFDVRVHPLFAQDFLSVFSPDKLAP